MSTWISERRLPTLLLCLGLAACVPGGPFATARDSTTLTVGGNAVTVAGPGGFCIDPGATRETAESGFTLFGNCATIAGRADLPQPDLRAVLTATVSGGAGAATIAGSIDALDGYFRSTAGRRALSRTGDPATVEVLETFQNEAVFYIHARDASPGFAPGMSPDYWRAYFDLAGRIVAVSAIGFDAAPLSRAQSLAALRAFAARIRAANAPEAAAATGPRPAAPV
ncbi:hypothetical protein ACQ5SP_10890 [Rhodovulum sp. YNF3179]|uniref:hypothetical protein n=1 Tax=Rhodovulum sp. YNF3179 TaxID=3425127 RepID=UPI003D34DC7F